MAEDFEIVGKCTGCGGTFTQEELRCLPDTEQFYRNLALRKVTIKDAVGLDMDTFLCPICYEKWINEHLK